MQRAGALRLALLAAVGCASGAVLDVARGAKPANPVMRVVELLKALSVDIEKESKTEAALYEDFKCWGKTVISTKTETNAAAQSRIDTLKTYISDLDAGRIELTTERVDLEKEIEQLSGEIELLNANRNKEHADYELAKGEMDKAIAALTSAVEVLRVATEGHEEGTLLSIRSSVQQGATAHAAEASTLAHAAELGERFLTSGDALFLRRLLTGEVPEADWKKLNQKATFKMSYQARSGKIQDVLAKLLETFVTNAADASKKEEAAKANYDTLVGAKKSQKESAQEALAKLSSENGAKGLSKAEAQSELAGLEKQVTDDSSYIAQVQATLKEKAAEWKDRSEVRAQELKALGQAISMLYSDDARGLFKKSFSSQGYSLLQLTEGSAARARRNAVEVLRAAAAQAGDARLKALAALAAGGHFDEVISSIDNMVTILKAEEESDLKYKEDCEGQRMNDTRTAIKAGHAIDDMTEQVASLQAEIAQIERQIAQKLAEVAQIEQDLATAAKVRAEEHAEFLVAQKEDQDAAALVERATEVLSKFYESKEDDAFFLQRQPDVRAATSAGAAPPPPPPTWQASYAGKQTESTGLIAILEMVADDIKEDEQKAVAAEAKAVTAYEQTKTALNLQKDDATSVISELDGTKGEKIESVEETKTSQRTKQGELGAVVQRIKSVESGCDFFTVNYELRGKNREIELDSLQRAKAILSGAVFETPEDPNREIRPGDALVQHTVRLHF